MAIKSKLNNNSKEGGHPITHRPGIRSEIHPDVSTDLGTPVAAFSRSRKPGNASPGVLSHTVCAQVAMPQGALGGRLVARGRRLHPVQRLFEGVVVEGSILLLLQQKVSFPFSRKQQTLTMSRRRLRPELNSCQCLFRRNVYVIDNKLSLPNRHCLLYLTNRMVKVIFCSKQLCHQSGEWNQHQCHCQGNQ